MSMHRLLAVAVSALLSAACFHQTPVVQVSQDATLNTRWHANLASPADLAGIVQMKGSASMAPSPDSASTDITIALANASPGGQHPWAVHRGQCGTRTDYWTGTDHGIFGPADAYSTLKVGTDGLANGAATVSLQTPKTGEYFAVIYASVANADRIVACGNLAPPTQ
jgi:hypothetical protein